MRSQRESLPSSSNITAPHDEDVLDSKASSNDEHTAFDHGAALAAAAVTAGAISTLACSSALGESSPSTELPDMSVRRHTQAIAGNGLAKIVANRDDYHAGGSDSSGDDIGSAEWTDTEDEKRGCDSPPHTQVSSNGNETASCISAVQGSDDDEENDDYESNKRNKLHRNERNFKHSSTDSTVRVSFGYAELASESEPRPEIDDISQERLSQYHSTLHDNLDVIERDSTEFHYKAQNAPEMKASLCLISRETIISMHILTVT